MKNGMQRTLLSVGVEFGKSSFVTAVRQGRVQISAPYPVEVFHVFATKDTGNEEIYRKD